MKDIRAALRALLLADPTINALVGGYRIHAVELPQGQTSPSLVYQRVFDFSDYNMQGDTGLQQVNMQINALATSRDGCEELAAAVHDHISGFHGIVEDVPIQGIFHGNGRDLPIDPTAPGMRAMTRDYRIFYAER